MTRARRLAVLAAALSAGAVLSVAAGCSGAARASAGPSAPASVTAAQVQRLFDAAGQQIVARNEAGWRAAVPSATSAARAALDAVYAHLAPLTWPRLSVCVHHPPGAQTGVMDVQFVGSPGGAGPPDRVVAEVLLDFRRRAGRVIAVRDVTPAGLRRQGLMAFAAPREITARACTVIYDSTWRARAAGIAKLVPAARAAVAATYHVRPLRPVAVFVYSSEAEAVASLGLTADQFDHRILFFTHPVPRLTAAMWTPADVGVVAPALFGQEQWEPTMLRHELTHAFTLQWFSGLQHSPDFFKEGLAVAVEDDRSFAPLRQALAASSVSLLAAMQVGDIWASRTTDAVRLAYAEAGATVRYVLARWGERRLYRWVRAVANSDLTDAAIMNSVKRELGISWRAFVSGWRAYASTL